VKNPAEHEPALQVPSHRTAHPPQFAGSLCVLTHDFAQLVRLPLPAVHVPSMHKSLTSHLFPSLHGVPSTTGGLEHAPVAGSHVPASWQESAAVHVTCFTGRHVPVPSQDSVLLQRFPSLQDAPAAATGFEQTPVLGSQVPFVWQSVGEGHSTASDFLHEPPLHWAMSQRLPSLHVTPSAMGA
jgi:hypothetical protein